MDVIRNNATQSEIFHDNLNFIQVGIYYSIFEEGNSYNINCPETGFLNIIFPETSSPCICPYFINQSSFIIRGGNNIIHHINKSDVLEWKNYYGHSTAIAVFIPQHLLSDLKIKFSEEANRFKNGLLTKSDKRISLLASQVLTHHKIPEQINKLRMQSLLLEALVYQIEGLFVENDKGEIISSKNHYEKIQMVKKLIDEDLSINYTLTELSRKVGTNEQYLKKYFKQYFGKTVMSYITEQRMSYAKELIKSGNYRVTDVARMTGYKHSTHFTTAFKKFYGFIPNSLRYTYLVASDVNITSEEEKELEESTSK